MQVWNAGVKWRLLSALIGGIAGGVSVWVAILAYRLWGWHILATMPATMILLQAALYPLTKKLFERAKAPSESA